MLNYKVKTLIFKDYNEFKEYKKMELEIYRKRRNARFPKLGKFNP